MKGTKRNPIMSVNELKNFIEKRSNCVVYVYSYLTVPNDLIQKAIEKEIVVKAG